MRLVVVWQHEQPAKTIQIAVIGMPRRTFGVRLGRELGEEPRGGRRGLVGQGGDAGPRDCGGRRARLAGRTGGGSLRKAEPYERDAALDDEEVGRHLTEPPVVIRPPGEVAV